MLRVPAEAYVVLKLGPLPVVVVAPGADQLYAPLPPVAPTVAVAPMATVCVGGAHTSGLSTTLTAHVAV